MSTLCRKSSAGLFLRENADAASEREGGRLYNRSPAMHVSCGFICSGDSMSTPSERSSPSVNGWQGEYVESLFAQWQSNPDSVGAEWRDFFRGFELGLAQPAPTGGGEVAPRVHISVGAREGDAPEQVPPGLSVNREEIVRQIHAARMVGNARQLARRLQALA